MTAVALRNLWTYIDGLSLKKKEREWLASMLVKQKADDDKTERQKAFVKKSLTRALREVKEAQREGRQLQTVDEFIQELRMEESL